LLREGYIALYVWTKLLKILSYCVKVPLATSLIRSMDSPPLSSSALKIKKKDTTRKKHGNVFGSSEALQKYANLFVLD